MKSFHGSKTNAVVLVFGFIGLAWLSPSKALEISTEIDVRRLFTVDMNYDGLDDLVVGGKDGVVILIADGQGGFEPPNPLSGAGLVGVADVNEDGFLDIITTTAVIFGHEASRWSIGPTHERVEKVGGEVADFDTDGHIDFIGESTIDYYIYYGDGTGNFDRDVTSRFMGGFLVVKDIDGDQLPDVVQGSQDGKVYVYRNLGQRKWSGATSYPFPLPPGRIDYIYRPAVADYTSDGIVDIVAGGHGYNDVYLFEGKGDGTFKDARQIAEFVHVGQMAVADFDKDGVSDVVAAGYWHRYECENLVGIIYGDPTGQFLRQTVLPLGSMHVDAATGDWDGDGWQDVAVLSWTTDTVSILFNDGTGSFADPPVLNRDDRLDSAADFDDDGYQDIILVRNLEGHNYLCVAYGNEDGTFGEPQQLSHKYLGAGFVLGYFDEVQPTILNGDPNRTLDVGYAIFTGYGARLYVILNKGNRLWSEPIRAAGNHDMNTMITGDFDEDGIQDIIDSGDYGNAHLLAGNGDGTFQVRDLGLDAADTLAVAVLDDAGYSATDLDNDGHLDIVAFPEQGKPGGWIGWGNGDGSFEFIWDERIIGRPSPYGIWLADVNGDGLPDIVDVDRVWLNLGNRSFGNASDFGGKPIDVNGDGILDLLKTYKEQGCLEVRFGDGHFGWSPAKVWVHGGWLSGDNMFCGLPNNPVESVLVGQNAYNWYRIWNNGYRGFWKHVNPWRNTVVTDTYGPRILDYIGPLNPGFTIAPAELVLTLSEPVDPATVNPDSVYLASAGSDGLLVSPDDVRLSGALSYDDASRRITFVPYGRLADGPYRFVVSGEGASAVRDLAGNALDGTVFDQFPSGNERPGGSFVSAFYVVASLPGPQALDSKQEDVSDEPTSPEFILFDSNRRATITGELKTLHDRDYYFLGELTVGDVVTVDLDGWGAGLTLEGGAVSILHHLPEGWVTFASACLTDGFVDSHLSFPVRYDGEYVLEVNSYSSITGTTIWQADGTYSIDVATDSASDPWGVSLSPQTIFLDFDGSQANLSGYVDAFDAGQLDFESARTSELITSITDKVFEDFAQFSNIIITTEQPEGVDYSRISVGPVPFIVDPQVDMWNLDYTDEGLVNSYSFWGIRHYGFDAVSQAMANTISHQIGHLLGLQHISTYHQVYIPHRIMNDETPIPDLIQDQRFSKGRYWWGSTYPAPEQDAVRILEYNTGPTLPPPVPPTIGLLTAEPNSANPGEILRLYAQDVSDTDGEVVKVEFYHDKNANSILDIGIDEYLGEDPGPSSGWKWPVQTNNYAAGIHVFLARAMDDGGAWSNVVSVTVTVGQPDSCVVAFDDFVRFADGWLQTGIGLPGDLDGDHDVDLDDLSQFADRWLNHCPQNWPLKR